MSDIGRLRCLARLARKPGKTRSRIGNLSREPAPVMSSHRIDQLGEAIAHFRFAIVNVHRNCTEEHVRRFIAGAPVSAATTRFLNETNDPFRSELGTVLMQWKEKLGRKASQRRGCTSP